MTLFRKFLNTAAILVILLLIASTAYTDMFDVLEEGQDVPEGIADIRYYEDEKRIEIDFSLYGAVLYVEMIRGNKNPLLMRTIDPDAPVYEIDMRMLDENRRTFGLRVAGHTAIDETWEEEWRRSVTSPRPERSQKAKDAFNKLVNEIPDILRKVKFKKCFQHEYKSLVSRVWGRITPKPPKPTSGIEPEAAEGVCGWDVSIRSKPVVDGEIGQHSALLAEKGIGPAYKIRESCNHGACASESVMRTKCTRYRIGCLYPDDEHIEDGMMDCDIVHHYSWNNRYYPESSWGIYEGFHLCNDDTKLQYYWWLMAMSQRLTSTP